MYQYKNDCLAASVEYNKDYYDDNDIKPEESIFFKLTIIPFVNKFSNLKNQCLKIIYISFFIIINSNVYSKNNIYISA